MRCNPPPGVRPADGYLALALAVGVLASVVWALLAWSLWPSAVGVALGGWLLAHAREVRRRAQLAELNRDASRAVFAAFALGVERASGGPRGGPPTIH